MPGRPRSRRGQWRRYPGARARRRPPGAAAPPVEATARKAAFLARDRGEDGRRGARCTRRARRISRASASRCATRCACVVARALAPPPVAAELCLPLCRAGRARRAVVARVGDRRGRVARGRRGCGGRVRASDTPGRARAGQARGHAGALPAAAGRGRANARCAAPGVRPVASLRSGECPGSTHSRTRRAGSARRPPRSTSPRAWRRPARACSLVDLDPQANASSGLGVRAGSTALLDLRPAARRRARRHHRADARPEPRSRAGASRSRRRRARAARPREPRRGDRPRARLGSATPTPT